MKSLVRTFILMAAMTFTYNCYCQTLPTDTVKETLLKNGWKTDHILGLDPNTETYKLTKYNPQEIFAGNLTQFLDNSTFHSQYTAWCGNDNFTNVFGKYKFLDKDKIAIAVDTVTYSGGWTKPTEHRKSNYSTFTISIVKDTLILTRQK
ncbi:hypothetical protein [Flavobacterium aestivum]|uniref:hypothetical protein n=1 Tax=Flavobacterium aestivum TaxID=3003257 RepID=UPI0022869EF1|nr:hypothetical protein [Flavobacterium aestivum]